jgi:glyoxylase-like metal-dependent hydrolase (beta-lactamase superfamily II)
MEKISSGVYIEDAYPGVIVGAVPVGEGVLLIDAPLRPEDGRTWLSALRGLKGGSDRVLVYLDSHTDRTLGGRVLESTVVAHKTVLRQFENRSSIFKSQIQESGEVWETCTGLSGIRWAPPQIGFTNEALLRWRDAEIILEHHPGPEEGAIWVILPHEEIVFIGDLVTGSQPPFLGRANLPLWEESLEELSRKYKNFTKVSSREGVITDREIKDMKKFISGVHKQLEKLKRRKAGPGDTERLIEKQLGSFSFEPRYRNHFYQRLKFGLSHCFARQYLSLEDFGNL